MTVSILRGAFALVARRPGSVAIWALLYLLGIFVIGLVRFLVAPVGVSPLIGFAGAIVTNVLMIGLIGVLLTAVTRATLHPYKTGFAFLRLGANEARVFALLLMLSIGGGIAILLLSLLLQFALGGLVALIGTGAAAGWISLLVLAAAIGGVILVLVRLAIALPLTYLYEQLTVDEAWTLSRGHFRSLFGAFLAIALLLLAGWALVMFVFFWPVLSALLHVGLDADIGLLLAAQAMNLPLGSQLTVMIAALLLVALGFVLATATLASAARELLGLKEGQLPDLSRRS